MADDRTRERVLSYLYGALSPDEEAAFRAELASSPELARVVAEEERLHRRLPLGAGPGLPDGALEESRLLLRAALRREARPAAPVATRLVRALEALLPRVAWAVGAVLLFASGLLVGRAALGPGDSLAAALARGRIVDVQVRAFDAASGRVDLELSALATGHLEGHLDDDHVRAVLAAALVGGLEPGPRLQAVELLRRQAAAAEVRRALSRALLADDNPGVRLAAAEALGDHAADGDARQALQQALLGDPNPGVRVAAVEALRGLTDAGTRSALERAASSESNNYIRAQARAALQGPTPAGAAHL